MSTGDRQTPDQQRARHAWEVISRVKNANDAKLKKDFGIHVRKLPMRVLASGLGAALAFLEAKKDAPELVSALSSWMENVVPVRPPGQARLLLRIIESDADFQRFATTECLAYLQWLVRFAEAEGLTKDAG
ncbi:type III-B CRISPR module-associated protein Cmr5 [Fimbriiglobus ruber]|uniref:CRISPR type III-B/RAMP module-associated protein Cmr5 n=1 Tax=Fimbriiglobus ruber TaxID=1908690 RepID=A0A225DN54_9BACT|nr:type III-B CRISPR module-associated protein Cmr5 [Fimbriiglobus ruber]OWK41124.1 crispr-associated protein Cmr5 family protein [Fimbriiglobus ruber]